MNECQERTIIELSLEVEGVISKIIETRNYIVQDVLKWKRRADTNINRVLFELLSPFSRARSNAAKRLSAKANEMIAQLRALLDCPPKEEPRTTS